MAARDGDRLIGAYASPSFASAVESAAAAHGLSKSAYVRRALTSALLPPGVT
jgi:hypothetical protein